MTHTWSDVAYGFFVGNGHDISGAEGVAFMVFVGFSVWLVYKA